MGLLRPRVSARRPRRARLSNLPAMRTSNQSYWGWLQDLKTEDLSGFLGIFTLLIKLKGMGNVRKTKKTSGIYKLTE